ncbi:MAG: type II toxin-antitoxin system VapC family toxin [Gemmatimonadaceae bacterium]
MRAAVDTGALLALASSRDQYHAQAVAIERRFRESGGRWVGSMLVLSELHAHLVRRADAAVARRVIAALLRDPAYEWRDVTVELLRAAVSAWLERFQDQRFSMTDAVTFEIMRSERIGRAFAFDRDFLTAGYELMGVS